MSAPNNHSPRFSLLAATSLGQATMSPRLMPSARSKTARLLGLAVVAAALAGCGEKALENNAADNTIPAAEQSEAVNEIAGNPLRNAYFGDLHIHTQNSFDAFVFGVRRSPDDAYRYAKGETIRHDGGLDITLDGPPLDFLGVTDHGEYLGIIPAMADPANPLSKTATAASAFGKSVADRVATFGKIGASFVAGEPIEDIDDRDYAKTVWANTVAATEAHNQPGTFTTFNAYEFTAMRIVDPERNAAANLHRNVIFRDQAPEEIFTTLDSGNPEDLWQWMTTQREQGLDSLAIPHNSNGSNGYMFAQETYLGEPLTAAWAQTRMANEPLVEITQIKGTSDTHPQFSPNDEWADFERYEVLIGSTMPSTPDHGSYVRQSLSRGLAIESQLGTNPYAFGVIGSSDTHVAAGSFNERNFHGKFPANGTPEGRGSIPPNGAITWQADASESEDPLADNRALIFSASGLAGVWAESNTREALFDAMRRRETFGTSGPRMKVRFFAGDYPTNDTEALLASPDLLSELYEKGAPMGSNVTADTSPVFVAWAMQDPLSAPLQRLQIVKAWDENSVAQEAVYDVACPGGDLPDADYRCPDNGASVDIATCDTTPGESASELRALWQDPAFNADAPAAYYVRALENPTCRWSTWDAVRNGTPPNPKVPATLQERAWSSPIWVE